MQTSTPRLLDVLSGSRTLWFIGDSTVLSHAQAAACRLASEYAPSAVGHNTSRQTSDAKWRAPEWPASKYAGCIDTAGLRVCYMPAGSRVRGASASVATVLERLVALNVIHRNDMPQEHLTFRWPMTREAASRRHEDRAESSLSMRALIAAASH